MIDGDWFARPGAREMRCSPAPDEVLAFHRSLPGYAPTPLVELPALAAELGLGRLLLKDESSRLGLPAFKVLGASWAIHRALAERALAVQALAGQAPPGQALAGQAPLVQALAGQALAGQTSLVVVPVGVGSLAQAVVQHYRSGTAAPALLAVEPRRAACALASLRAGEPVSVPTGVTVMAGLNCGTVSGLAWPYLAAGLDAAVAVSDAASLAAVAELAALGVAAGPCGAATLAGLRATLSGPGAADRRAALGLDQRPDPVVVLLSTEGAEANPIGQ